MKLATLADGTRDGRLIVVRRDGACYVEADGVRTMQALLDDWDALAPAVRRQADALERDAIPSAPVDLDRLRSPLPRAYEWIDGSAYLNHVRLVRKARNAAPPPTLETDPLVYQGGSGTFLDPRSPIPLRDPAWGLDFEAEVVVILGDVPMGTRAQDAGQHIRLVTICNDVSLRGLIPKELEKGFGFFQSKPSTAFAPFALTPDELGDAWSGGRLHLPMLVEHNDRQVGRAEAGESMHFGFHELIEHIARTRAFTAGTVLGSGTVSNEDPGMGISCLAEIRMIETIAEGKPSTPFMAAGDTVRIRVLDRAGHDLFGTISQVVVAVP